MTQEDFLMDAATAQLFFRACMRYGIKGYEERLALLRELVRRKKMKYLRDVAPVTDGKKVLKIIPKEPK